MKLYLIIINIISFICYGIDKYRSIKNKFRISEKSLFILSFLGGMIGSIIGMRLFHHKTKKYYFYIVNILSLIIWIFIIYKVYE